MIEAGLQIGVEDFAELLGDRICNSAFVTLALNWIVVVVADPNLSTLVATLEPWAVGRIVR